MRNKRVLFLAGVFSLLFLSFSHADIINWNESFTADYNYLGLPISTFLDYNSTNFYVYANQNRTCDLTSSSKIEDLLIRNICLETEREYIELGGEGGYSVLRANYWIHGMYGSAAHTNANVNMQNNFLNYTSTSSSNAKELKPTFITEMRDCATWRGNECYLTPDTELSFDIYSRDEGAVGLNFIRITGWDYELEDTHYWYMRFEDAWNAAESCDVVEITGNHTQNGWYHFNSSISNILAKCDIAWNSDNVYNNTVDTIIFSLGPQCEHVDGPICDEYKTGTIFGLDNITITGINRTVIASLANSIPTCSYEIETLVCMNQSQIYQIPLNLSCNDVENDTIYYFTEYVDLLNRYTFIEEGFDSFNFFTEGAFASNHSYSEDYEEAERYVAGWTIVPYSIIGSLAGNNILITDNGVDTWTYTLEQDLIPTEDTQISFNWIIGFPDDDTEVEIKLFENFGDQIINITMYQDGDNMTIYNDTTLIYNAEQDLMTSNYENYYILSGSMMNGSIVVLIEDYSNNYILNTTKPGRIDSFKSIQFNTNDEHLFEKDFWVLDNIVIRGWNYNIVGNYSTNPPTYVEIDVHDLGTVWRLRVTDLENLPYYNEYEEYIQIVEDCDQDEIGQGISEDYIVGGLRKVIRDFLEAIGVLTLLQAAIWLFYILILGKMINKFQEVKKPFFLANLIFFVVSFIVGSTAQLISSIILLAISIIVMVVLR